MTATTAIKVRVPIPREPDRRTGPAAPRAAGSRFPRLPLYSALLLIAVSIAAAAFGRYTDIGTLRNPTGNPVEIRDLTILLAGDGRLVVADAHTHDQIAVLAPETDGFMHGAMRGLSRDRTLRGGKPDDAYRLIRWSDGRLTLSDTATGLRIDLRAFGPTNVAAVARFLQTEGGKP